MRKMSLVALILAAVVALGCDGTAIDVRDVGADTLVADVQTEGPCCTQYTAGSQVIGCWFCAGKGYRCAGTRCEVASATMPLCQVQPSAPYVIDSPSCD